MKVTKFLFGLCAVSLAAACDFGAPYSAFNDVASFEYAYTLAEQVAMPECKDSLIILEKPFRGGNYFVLENAQIVRDRAVKPGFLISMRKDNVLSADYPVRPLSSFGRTGGYQSFAYAIFADVRGGSASHSVTFGAAEEGTATFVGFYVNNTHEIVNLVTYGSETVEPFQDGDQLLLTVTAFPSGSRTEVMLAEHTGGKLEVINSWKEITVANKDAFTYLDFSVTSNRTDIPLNVCIDNLVSYVVFGEKK